MESKSERATELRNEAMAGTVGRLFQMLVDIYGEPELESLEKVVKKREGQEVELNFKPLDVTVTFTLSRSRLIPHMGKSSKSVGEVILNMPREDLIPSFNEFIRTKNNLWGLLKMIFKYFLTGKIKIKGSLGACITLWKLLFIGKHSMYEN